MTAGTGIIEGVSVSHTYASVEEIETACTASQTAAAAALLELPGVSEAFVLQTCNRAEAFVVADEAETGREALAAYSSAVDPSARRDLDHEASLRHLLRVACGLESLVIGEDQILGQVRDALDDAREAGAVGPVLEDALLKALHVGERARDETPINEGVVSIGSAAVRLAARERNLSGDTAVVVGAGEMGTLAARALDGVVERVVVVNRTRAAAEHVVEELTSPAAAVGLEELSAAVETADVVVTATASDGHLVGPAAFDGAGETLVVDVAQPRDVAPAAADLDGVVVHDLDSIQSVTDDTRRRRREAAEAVEAIIDEEFDNLISQYKRQRADEVIAAMYEGAERIKARELQTAVSKLEAEGEVDDAQREVLESMADALVGQLLSAPTKSLRDAAENDDWSTINTALQLFDPGFDPDAVPDAATDPAADAFDGGGPGEPGVPDLPDAPEGIPEDVRQQVPAAVLEQLSAAPPDDD